MLNRLGLQLSGRQHAHVQSFRLPAQKYLRLLCRKMALAHAGSDAFLDMDCESRPIFPAQTRFSTSFSYAGDHAFCAFYNAENDAASMIGLDASSSTLTIRQQQAMSGWFAKLCSSSAGHDFLHLAESQQLLRLWLLHECFIKLNGICKLLRAFDSIMRLAFNNNDRVAINNFHARFLTSGNFRFCIAGSENILKEPIKVAI